ncbi:MBL fold metallo-hydrolase RNA specificity domain-containing protein [Bacteroidota bacterium]
MRIKFCGAARTVTGSQHLLEINGKKILLDCGMFQGKREESFKMNRKFLFEPEELHSVILSHAHIDHSGNLPTLSRKGFNGNVYSTAATRDLCSIMLQDSAYIQERDVEYANKRRKKKGEILFNPLYTIDNVRDIMRKFKSMPYGKKFYVEGFENKLAATFNDAGHILGSSTILLDINENGRSTKLGFTGDLGRFNLPILKDPEFMGDVDFLISESTYGGRIHEKAEMMEKQLEIVMNETIARNGKIIVPAFSVGRTQEIVYALSKLFTKKAVPEIPIYVDSPLSVNTTEIFKVHMECFDEEASRLVSDGLNVFGLDNITYIKDAYESKKLNSLDEPCMIISASGMCEAGRILHHLKNNVRDEKNTILIIGFMAEHTLGRRLVEAKNNPGTVIKIFGDEYTVNAKIRILNSFSAHADKNELLDYFNLFDKKMLKKVFLVHGEIDQQELLKESLKEHNIGKVEIPVRGEYADI